MACCSWMRISFLTFLISFVSWGLPISTECKHLLEHADSQWKNCFRNVQYLWDKDAGCWKSGPSENEGLQINDPVRDGDTFQMEVHAVHVVGTLSCSCHYQGIIQIKTSDFISSTHTRRCNNQWKE
jgi:hypothetical protein